MPSCLQLSADDACYVLIFHLVSLVGHFIETEWLVPALGAPVLDAGALVGVIVLTVVPPDSS